MNGLKVKVLFGENKIIGGTMFGKGVYEQTPEAARASIAQGGVVSAEDRSKLEKYFNQIADENAPLSVEETMERMKAGDFSEEVFRSAQYHNAEIARRMNPTPATFGDIATPAEVLVAAQTNPSLRESGEDAGNASNAADLTQITGGTGNEGNEGANNTGGQQTGGAASDDLPEDFPWRAELVAGEVTTLSKLRGMKPEDLKKIAGLGDTRINHIGARLAAMDENK